MLASALILVMPHCAVTSHAAEEAVNVCHEKNAKNLPTLIPHFILRDKCNIPSSYPESGSSENTQNSPALSEF